MSSNARLNLVAPCGIDCGICEPHACAEDPKLLEALVARGIPREKLPCPGCREVQGMCPVLPDRCATYTCVTGKGLSFCHECAEFPCTMLQPSADRANVLPHNLKVFNLCTIRRAGVEAFVAASPDIKRRYYQGKMAVGRGPQT